MRPICLAAFLTCLAPAALGATPGCETFAAQATERHGVPKGLLTAIARTASVQIVAVSKLCCGRAAAVARVVDCLRFIAYNHFGHRIEGQPGHRYISPGHFIDINAYTTDGLFGIPVRVAATYAFLFVMFGTFLEKARGGEFFFRLSAAFIMSEVTGISYGAIALAAVLPTALYYPGVYIQVHLRSVSLNPAPLDKTKVPGLGQTMREGWMFLLPLTGLIILLVVGYSPTMVAAVSTLAVWLVPLIRSETRMGLRATSEALSDTAIRMLGVTWACALLAVASELTPQGAGT